MNEGRACKELEGELSRPSAISAYQCGLLGLSQSLYLCVVFLERFVVNENIIQSIVKDVETR